MSAARIATDNITIRNIFARYVEADKPATFAERMALQRRAMMDVFATTGVQKTADNVSWLGAIFAEVCPNGEVR